ncbi:uncharacterized protein BDW70DRAFT_79389 [Aspergillus foveolatus]|uniref:uncharacterized protein n=1 Tax=Aspergillus foveolatus TaxID=210207 RepID=UPI003CCD1BEF
MMNLLNLVLLLLLSPSLSVATCYYPNGNEATTDVQCTPGDNSACCGSGSICLSNGLCMSIAQPFGLSRGSCTDPNFEIDECTSACTNIQRNTGCAIVPYNSTDQGVYYCCNSIVNNVTGPNPSCDLDLEPFTLQSATIVPGAGLLKNYVELSDSDNTANTNITARNRTDACADADTSDSNTDVKTVAVGAGLGVPLGVLALAGFLWALYERRRRLRTITSDCKAPVADYSPMTVSEEFYPKTPALNEQLRYSQPVELADS